MLHFSASIWPSPHHKHNPAIRMMQVATTIMARAHTQSLLTQFQCHTVSILVRVTLQKDGARPIPWRRNTRTHNSRNRSVSSNYVCRQAVSSCGPEIKNSDPWHLFDDFSTALFSVLGVRVPSQRLCGRKSSPDTSRFGQAVKSNSRVSAET